MGQGARSVTAMVAGLAFSLLPFVAGGIAEAQDRKARLDLGGMSYDFIPPEDLCPVELDHASLALPVRQYLFARTVKTQFDEGLGLVLWLADCDWLRRVDNLEYFYGPFFPARMMVLSVPVRPNGQFGTMGSMSREAYIDRLDASNDETSWPASDAEALATMANIVATAPASDEPRTVPTVLLARRERERDVVYVADLKAHRTTPSRTGGQGEPYWQVSAAFNAITVLGDFPLVLQNRDLVDDGLPADRLQSELQAVLRQLRSQDDGRR
ncbi:hypothetical protein ACFOGJ_09525 [Marinibaculum pumilum]|uniref:Uncharacterized protein n=1 Tax=Marinibaculum pumilum TaxID=1766165 RepID=A0ABV7KZ44_9PROT